MQAQLPTAPGGPPLALAAAVFLTAAVLFGLIAADVAAGRSLTRIDLELAESLHRWATPELTRWILLLTHLHSTFAVSLYAVVIGVYLAAKSRWRWLTILVVAIAGGLTLNILLKLAFQRSRPVFDEPLLTLSTYSFPSGHAVGTTLLYGLLVAYAFSRTPRWHWRLLAGAVALAAIGAVAFSRMYLGVHYFSDVAAGFLEGVAWLTLTLAGCGAVFHRRDASRAHRRDSKEEA